MSDYATRLDAAHRRLQALSDLPCATPQAETLAPVWLTTPAGLAFLEALAGGAEDEAVTIYDAAYGDALDAWTRLLWLAPMPTTKEN